MDYAKKSRFLVLLLLLIGFSSLAYSAPVNLEFDSIETADGVVSVLGKASSGTKVTLLVNGNVFATKDIIAPSENVLLTGNLQNQIIPAGAQLTFTNDNPGTIYKLRVEDISYNEIALGESATFLQYEDRSYLITDEESSITKEIVVTDEFVNFQFDGIETYLFDGANNQIVFQVQSLGTADSNEYTETVSYDKFTNTISIDPGFINVTDSTSIRINGSLTDSDVRLFYVVNINGEISNTGVLNPIELDGNSFDFRVSTLVEGVNTIRLISTDKNNLNLFNGETVVNVLSDRFPPSLEIVDVYFRSNANSDKKIRTLDDQILTNANGIILNISSDATILNYTFNGNDEQTNFEKGFVELQLSLSRGQNNLTLTVIDAAGNINKEAHQIHFDDERPKLIRDSLEPDEVFDGNARFFFEKIDGKTNKPNVKLTIFTFVRGAQDLEGNDLSCDRFEDAYVRNLEDLGRDNERGPQVDTDDIQVSLTTLLAAANEPIETRSDSSGDFDAIIAFQEDNFDSRDFNNNNNFDPGDFRETEPDNEVDNVDSRNELCFILEDEFGNVNLERFSITLDAGNTLWKATDVTTIPNTVYAAEIEQTGGPETRRIGSGNVGFGLIARFQYIGPGTVDRVSSFRVRPDQRGAAQSRFVSLTSSRIEYTLDRQTNELIAYIPVEVDALGIDPLDYPENLDLSFAATIRYEVGEDNIPVDEINPIYFQTTINIEKPLDHTKWLTPSTIESIQSFLNKTMKFTRKAEKALKWASIGGVLACTYKQFENNFRTAALLAEYQSVSDPDYIREKTKLDRQLFLWCDRVASTASPYVCKANGIDGSVILSPDEFRAGIEFSDEQGAKRGVLDQIEVGPQCDPATGQISSTGTGRIVTGTGARFEEESAAGAIRTVKDEVRFNQCLKAEGSGDDLKVDFGSLKGSICFSPGPPSYDDTRCNFFGADNDNDNGLGPENAGGVPGRDSASSIISSIRCGAITDTYSHTKNLNKIQEGIYQCMEEAKLGVVKGSYCERLLGQAVCDIATNVVLPEVLRNVQPREGAGGEDSDRANPNIANFLQVKNQNERAFDQRYRGTIFSQTGLGTDQIINKACIGAITGDWSVLTDNVLTAIDQNEVEPVFGPPFAESRIQGYNPITGTLDIRYLFTYGVISGGQTVFTDIELVCDPGAPNGEYCPEDRIVISSEVPGRGFKQRRESVNRGGSKQISVIITDGPATFWYNQIRFTHKYDLKGRQQTDVRVFPVAHKEEIPLECSFTAGIYGAGAGFACESIFGDIGDGGIASLFTIDERDTRILPQDQETFYPGNSVYLDLAYSARNADSFNEDVSLAYMTVCNENRDDAFILRDESGKAIGNVRITDGSVVTLGKRTLQLYEDLPEIGSSFDDTIATIRLQDENAPDYKYIVFTSIDRDFAPPIDIKDISIGGLGNLNLARETNTVGFPKTVIAIPNDRIPEAGDTVRVVFNGQAPGIVVSLGNEDLNLFSSEFEMLSGDIVEGQCTLNMRLMPGTQGSQLTPENFFEFNAVGDYDEEGRFQSSTDVAGIVEKKFSIGKRRNENIFVNHFDFSEPYQAQTFCIDRDSDGSLTSDILRIPLVYIFQNSANIDPNDDQVDAKLEVSVTSNKYVFGNSRREIDIQNGINGLTPKKFFEVELPEKLVEDLEALNTEGGFVDTVEANAFGVQQTPELTLTYRFEAKNKIENSFNTNVVSIGEEEDSVRFFLTARDNCNLAPGEREREGDGTTDGGEEEGDSPGDEGDLT